MWAILKFFIEFVTIAFYGHKACRILAPWPGIKPTPSASEGEALHGTTREAQLNKDVLDFRRPLPGKKSDSYSQDVS